MRVGGEEEGTSLMREVARIHGDLPAITGAPYLDNRL
jgi:hypothetical protein